MVLHTACLRSRLGKAETAPAENELRNFKNFVGAVGTRGMMNPIAKRLILAGLLTAVGLWAQSPHRALHPAAAGIAPPQPVVLAQLQRPTAAPQKSAQPLPAPRPKFDVVSVRRCTPGRELPGPPAE